MEVLIMSIGQRIKNRRKELNLSVDELANKLGKNRATIYRYEGNEIENLPITVLEPLSKVLKTTPAYLMGWENSPNSKIIQTDTAISLSEKNILRKYRQLDEKGQHTVDIILDMEYNRCTNDYLMPIAAHADNEDDLNLLRQDLDEL